MKYNTSKSLIENALMKAEDYEKQVNKERAEVFLEIAEKIEAIKNKKKV